MADSETDIKNLALNRIGETVLTEAQFTADTLVNAKFCNLNYPQTRDFLLRTHWWRFAGSRATLVAATAPAFQWAYAWTLPDDFLRMKYWWDDNNTRKGASLYSYELEGKEMFTNENNGKIKYIKKETTVTNFDSLFVEVFVLTLAMKIVMPIAKSLKMKRDLQEDLKPLMVMVRTIDKQEQNTVGRGEADTWNDALFGGGMRDPTKLGSN